MYKPKTSGARKDPQQASTSHDWAELTEPELFTIDRPRKTTMKSLATDAPEMDPELDPPMRRRGRPKGNPPALTLEERRARNAQMERERRDRNSMRYGDLRAALGKSPTTSRMEILRTALEYIATRLKEPSVADLKRQNRCLEEQIAQLSRRTRRLPPAAVKRAAVESDSDDDS